jgi:hypothetical protein
MYFKRFFCVTAKGCQSNTGEDHAPILSRVSPFPRIPLKTNTYRADTELAERIS